MCKKTISTTIYKSIYGRIKCISEMIDVSKEIIINNWLLIGMTDGWKTFTDLIEELENENLDGEDLREQLEEICNALRHYYLKTDEHLKEYDFQENFIDKHFEFSTIAEDVEFRKHYFSSNNKRLNPNENI